MLQAQDIHSQSITFPEKETLYWYNGWSTPPFKRLRSDKLILSPYDVHTMNRIQTFYCHLFDMRKPEDLNAFTEIKNRVLQGWCKILKEDTRWTDDSSNVLIWLEWIQIYSEFKD